MQNNERIICETLSFNVLRNKYIMIKYTEMTRMYHVVIESYIQNLLISTFYS